VLSLLCQGVPGCFHYYVMVSLFATSQLPIHGYSSEVLPTRTSYHHPARHHMMSHEVLSSTRSDPFGGSQIKFPVDMGKNVYIVSENESYGFLLRHFSIKESHEVRYS